MNKFCHIVMMKDDPTIDQIREIRRRISARCDHDPKKIVDYYMALQEKFQERLVNPAKLEEDCQDEFAGTDPVTV